MPPDVRDWLADNHLVWFVLAAVGEMDLWSFYPVYRVDGKSRRAYEPAMMVAGRVPVAGGIGGRA
jgi:hypothetical protein